MPQKPIIWSRKSTSTQTERKIFRYAFKFIRPSVEVPQKAKIQLELLAETGRKHLTALLPSFCKSVVCCLQSLNQSVLYKRDDCSTKLVHTIRTGVLNICLDDPLSSKTSTTDVMEWCSLDYWEILSRQLNIQAICKPFYAVVLLYLKIKSG